MRALNLAAGFTIEAVDIGIEEFDLQARRVNVDNIAHARDATSWLLSLDKN